MKRVRLERNHSQRPAARVVLSVKIALQRQPSVAHDDDAVKIPDALLGNGLVEPRLQIVGEAGFSRRRGAPVERGSRTCPD